MIQSAKSSPKQIVPVILSGGSGTRLWPVSRTARPKQLLALTGPETMIQLTARRTAGDPMFGPALVVASAAHADAIEAQLAELGAPPALLILEPTGRNTAAAIALAALALEPDALMLVMPSDHLIADDAGFRAAVATGLPLAAEGWLVTFGITPDRPETGYGYIRAGEPLAEGARKVRRFVEKPDRATAEALLKDGEHSWNSGIFLFSGRSYLAALEQHAPDILASVREAVNAATPAEKRISPDAAAFARCRSESIDYAVLEKADRVAVVPVELGWSDIGSWDALHEVGSADASGNVIAGDVVALDASNCLIRSEGPLVTTVGVSDLIVVATADAVLILPKGASQDVKRIVETLKRDRHPTLDRDTTV